jgi:hypothetical protein
MDRRGLVLTGVAGAVVLGIVALAVLPRPPRPPRDVATHEPPAPPRMTPADLYAGFARPGVGLAFAMPVTTSAVDAGDVVLPSGKLVASDGFLMGGDAFTLDLSPGEHPVSLLRVVFDDGDQRIAAAMVRVSDGEPSSWELALVPGQDPATLAPDEIFGYGVDSGTGAFTSPEAVAAVTSEADYARYADSLMSAMPATTEAFELSGQVVVDEETGANVVAFASGFGDGSYASYVGRDDDGNVVAVLTDFGVLDAARD